MKELKEREMSECTFKPMTNEGRNKKIINELLRGMDEEARPSRGSQSSLSEEKENYGNNFPRQQVDSAYY